MAPQTADTTATAATETKPDTKALALFKEKGKTRGRYQRDIEYNQLNRIPVSFKEFQDVTGVKETADVCELLFIGYNEQQYRTASDEIGEYINDDWDKPRADNFRITVRGMVKMTGMTVEEVAGLLKPKVQAAFEAEQAEKAAKAAAEANKAAEPVAATA